MKELSEKGQKAKKASFILANASSAMKDKALQNAASNLRKYTVDILKANDIDLQNAEKNGIKGSLIDRLRLTEERIEGIAAGLEQIVALEDPVGEVLSMWKRPNGLRIGQRRVPLGVVGIIYEARPNVTVDVFGLCIKTGNASILRGRSVVILSITTQNSPRL